MKKKLITIVAVLFFTCMSTSANAQEGMLAEVRLFAGNFAPRGWALCEGQLLSISQYSAVFSLLGTMYGGDGRTTFALPDLRGRVPVGVGRGPGLSPVSQGEKSAGASGAKPLPGDAGSREAATTTQGQPTLGLRYIICLQGVFPSRS